MAAPSSALLALLLLVLAVFPTSVHSTEQYAEVGDIGVRVIGNSAQIEIGPTQTAIDESSLAGTDITDDDSGSTDDDSGYLRLKMRSLAEKSDNCARKTSNKIDSFASQDFDWLTPEEVTVQDPDANDQNATKIEFTATLDVGGNDVPFKLTLLVFDADWSVSYGTGTVNGTANSVKFQLTIGSAANPWPFLDNDNCVEFEFRIEWNKEYTDKFENANTVVVIDDDDDDFDGEIIVTTPGGLLNLSQEAIAGATFDGSGNLNGGTVIQVLNTAAEVDGSEGESGKVDFTVQFSGTAWNNNGGGALFYDPILDPGAPGAESTGTGGSSLLGNNLGAHKEQVPGLLLAGLGTVALLLCSMMA